jgi:signal transduction histidine kinase
LRASWRLVTIGGTALLAAIALDAGLGAAEANPWLVVLDVSVGIGFLAGAAVAPGSWRMRTIVGAVGVAWLAGWIIPAPLAHQGVLIVAVVAFPAGRPRHLVGWVAVAAAVPVALGLAPQPAVALVFGAASVASFLRLTPVSSAWPSLTAGAVALAVGATWLVRSLDPFLYDPLVAEVSYDVILLLAAIGFPVAMRVVEDRSTIGRRVLAAEGLTGLAGLTGLLADALRDPSIQVYRWDPAEERYFDASDQPMALPPPVRWRPVSDGDAVLGAVAYRSAALDDERTAAAVADALRLALRNIHRQQELRHQLRELEDARARLVATVDRERASVAAELRDRVVAPISEAASALRGLQPTPADGDAAGALAVALDELDGASQELMQLVRGLGPEGLGTGGLARLLRDVAARSPQKVVVDVDPAAVAGAAVEASLYYVCLEAMANAAKHASASTLRITIRRRRNSLEAVIADDGVGGADPRGSGLGGLADRLAAVGGQLRVVSLSGAGTTVIATVPISRSSASRSGSDAMAPSGQPRRR